MMDDIEKTKPVGEAPADDGETGAGCDVCMPPIALVGAEDYDYKYLCMPSMVARCVEINCNALHAIDAMLAPWDSLVCCSQARFRGRLPRARAHLWRRRFRAP